MNSTKSKLPKFGARVYLLPSKKLLVKQTTLRGEPPEYVIDEHKEQHVSVNNDVAIADAIRKAVSGELPAKGR
jgi:hypothetical protein